MITIPDKAKQFLLLILKLLIVCIAFYYIFSHFQNKKTDWNTLISYLDFTSIIILLLFSISNWTLEILKWQNLISYFKTISFLESTKQSLGSLTASIFTPNRIGEYGAKMLYYPKENAKKIMFLNFISNGSQMVITCFFGLFGFLIYSLNFTLTKSSFWINFNLNNTLLVSLGVLTFLFIFFYIFRKKEFYGFSVQKLFTKTKEFPKQLWITNFQLSIMRYFVFSHQFYFLLIIFNCNISYSLALATIFIMYLFASIIPSIQFMDIAIKGSVALFLFNNFNIESWKIVIITSLMWIFNLVIPVLIGSYFVLQFKPQKT